ncbi:MAG: hypothetical protein ACKPAF_03710, partial [Actinomycetota bacterium]
MRRRILLSGETVSRSEGEVNLAGGAAEVLAVGADAGAGDDAGAGAGAGAGACAGAGIAACADPPFAKPCLSMKSKTFSRVIRPP